ncbi:MAG: hypothetical protein AAF485_27300, partial [Chloroflexota bacterium]
AHTGHGANMPKGAKCPVTGQTFTNALEELVRTSFVTLDDTETNHIGRIHNLTRQFLVSQTMGKYR